MPSFVENCFDNSIFRSIDAISISGPALVRKVFTSRHQVPDSFPFVIEREFGANFARGYEEYLIQRQKPTTMIENIDKNMDFAAGIDHMNQVVSFDRLVYFGYICEESGLVPRPEGKASLKPKVAFGKLAVEHKEMRQIKDELINNYSVSPMKIRKAGLEEMQSLMSEA